MTDLKKSKNKSEKDWYSITSLAALVFLVPLLVNMSKVALSGSGFYTWTGEESNYDFFSYKKMVLTLILCVITIGILIFRYYKYGSKAFKKSFYIIPICIYTLCVILSAVFAQYKHIALFGAADRYEGMFVLAAYMVILFAAINLVNSDKQIKYIFYALFASSTIIGIIGFFQYFNMDLFNTNFGKHLMLPFKYWASAPQLSFNLGPRAVYATLYHYNYVGSFMAMLFPLTLTIFLFIKDKKNKIFMGLLCLLMFAVLIMSKSRAGLIGAVLALVILVIMSRKYIMKYKKISIAVLASFIIIFIGINIAMNGIIFDRIKVLFKDTESLFNKNATSHQEAKIKSIEINNGVLTITTDKNKLNVSTASKTKNNIVFKDSNNNILYSAFNKKSSTSSFTNPHYNNFYFKFYMMGTTPLININANGIDTYFAINDGKIKYASSMGKVYNDTEIKHWGFEGKESLASGRAYIWSRTIPLLKNTIIFGNGPDTFAAYFPQYDYVGKLKTYGELQYIDKPHSLYLQNAINTGIISLLSIVALFIFYIVSCFRLYFNMKFKDLYSIAGLGIFVSVVGYLGAAFLNDSVISVAPVFWTLLGVGISINIYLKDKMAKE